MTDTVTPHSQHLYNSSLSIMIRTSLTDTPSALPCPDRKSFVI